MAQDGSEKYVALATCMRQEHEIARTNNALDDGCQYANDGECDVPDYCDEGTDVSDCECQYTNDGECDEPECLLHVVSLAIAVL